MPPLDAASMLQLFELVGPMVFGGLAILARVAAMFLLVPELGTGYIPRRMKLVLFASIAATVSFGLGLPAIPVDTSLIELFLLIAREVLLGAGLGFAVRLILAGVQMAGDLSGTSMGLSMASFFDRAAGENPLATGRLFSLTAAMAFIVMDGHRVMMTAMMEHFIAFPVGSLRFEVPGPEVLSEAIGRTMVVAVILAAPVIVVAFVFNLAKGLVMRMVPEFNLFNVGAALLFLGGMSVLSLAGDAILGHVAEAIDELPLRMQDLAGGRRG
jgi:flagellar biosynthetic protein FliR